MFDLFRLMMIRIVNVLVAVLLFGSVAQGDDWPQWLGPQRDGVWREQGILDTFPEGGARVLWRQPVGGGYAGPAVANGRVFVVDRQLATGALNPDDQFERGSVPGTETVRCFSADGKPIWQHAYDSDYTVSYPEGPRATPLVSDGRVYTLGAEGDLLCLSAETGQVLWERDFVDDFGARTPTWGFAAHPLVVGDQLICVVGAEDGLAMAFHKETGEVLWRALSAKEPGYCPPTLIETPKGPQLIIWHPEAIQALEPNTGKVIWSLPWAIRYALTISQPRPYQSDKIFFTSFYNGPLMLRVPTSEDVSEPEVLWRGPKASEKDTWGLHSIMPTPHVVEDRIYGVCSYGQLRCLEAGTGERVWETFEATTEGEPVRWANAFIVQHHDRYFLFNEQGDLIIAKLTPDGYQEISRANILKPTGRASGRPVVWSHPAFANRCVYARNDESIVCVSLATH